MIRCRQTSFDLAVGSGLILTLALAAGCGQNGTGANHGDGLSSTSDAGGSGGGSAGGTGASDAASEVAADGPAARACADAGAPSGFHVSPAGKPSGDGSALAPWDLATALAQPAGVRPGATLWLHGGVYKGAFTSALAGELANPITVRGAPGEHAVLDGVDAPNSQVLTINGAYSVFRDFEVTNSFATRVIMSTGSNPADARGSGVGMYGKGVKLIDLVIHDTGVGVGNWSPAPDGEVYGCIIFYNGWDAPDRGHGHGIYAQNETGMKLLMDNVIFRQFSYGIHGYTEGGKIDNFDVEGNIVFNNGELSRKSGFATDILVGGLQVAQSPRLHQNVTYFPKGEGSNNLGYSAGCTTATVTENYFVAATALEMVKCVGTVERNTFVGAVAGFDSLGYPSNGYSTQLSGSAVKIRPNKYDPGRAHLAIFNWDKLDAVEVDVSGVLSPGDAYELLDVQDLFGPPVLSGVYTAGKLAVPMTSTAVTTPVGSVPVSVTHTSREFGAFLIRKACPGAP